MDTTSLSIEENQIRHSESWKLKYKFGKMSEGSDFWHSWDMSFCFWRVRGEASWNVRFALKELMMWADEICLIFVFLHVMKIQAFLIELTELWQI